MKTTRRTSRRGFALLLTLIIVSFAAAIAVMFLLSARQERGGTDSYAQGVRVRQLADTAVNIVMGQINKATREGTASTPISWATQPGMIRTYTTSGDLSYVYKLYSWPNMIETGAAFNPQPNGDPNGEYPAATWYNLPEQYTDLNAPVTVSSGGGTVQVYPIMDPSVFNTSTGLTTTAGGGATHNNNSAQLDWDFFNEVAAPAAADPTQAFYPNPAAANANSAVPSLPMPVQWLYVLQDGTWAFPSSISGTSATFDSTVVTNTNPIVGRIAFWTDDETNKVNLNTAGEGVYWDWPKAASQDEMQFAGNPPVRNEFWRVSGHPASTSLSAVFPDVMGNTMSGGTPNDASFSRWNYGAASVGYGATGGGASANPSFITGIENILGLSNSGISPRYAFGINSTGLNPQGSAAGTFPVPYYQYYPPTQSGPTSGTFANGSPYAPADTYSPIILNSYRLYATPDELYFTGPVSGTSRNTETYGLKQAGITQYTLSQRFAFITTNSRAPETTLFNTPRVSMWPITWPYASSYWIGMGSSSGGSIRATAATAPTASVNPNSNNLSSLDSFTWQGNHWIAPQEDLIAFDSTLNSQGTGTPATGINPPLPYYFQRQSNDSPTNDWANITRNQQLANYVRSMVKQNVPGFGSSLETAWGATNADYITLECMDYCRSMVNQYTYDPSSTSGNILYSFTGVQGSSVGFMTNGSLATPFAPIERMAQVSNPLRIPSSGAPLGSAFTGTPPSNSTAPGAVNAYVTEGGDFPSLKEVALLYMAVQRVAPYYLGPTTGSMSGSLIQDPFYWANLINMGGAPGSIAPQPTATVQTMGGWVSMTTNLTATSGPDGQFTDTGQSNLLEKFDMYPVGARTNYMKGILLFDFAGLRDGKNAAPSPDFWIKVTGGNNVLAVTSAGLGAFASTITGEYRGRYSQGSTDTIFETLKGTGVGTFNGVKTFNAGVSSAAVAPAANNGLSNWPFCTAPIPVSPSDTTFTFAGGALNVALYACNPTSPDSDPTGTPANLITSYNVTGFASSNFSTTQPVPIAPRWNVRQARQVPFPYISHVLQYTQSGELLTSMTEVVPSGTYNTNTSGTADVPLGQNGLSQWVATEVVPDIGNIDSWTWGGDNGNSPTPANHPDVRDTSVISNTLLYPLGADQNNVAPLDGGSNNGWIMYSTVHDTGASPEAYTGSLYISGTDSDIPVPSGNNLIGWSLSMQTRYYSGNPILAAEGTGTVPASSGTNVLFTNTTYVPGGGPDSYFQEGYWEITPYDTVMSCMVDPAENTASQADPRLANIMGETLKFNDSWDVMDTLNGGVYAPAMVLNYSYTTPLTAPFIPALQAPNPNKTSFQAMAGFLAYPRGTFQAQYHELGAPGYQQYMTGYHLLPVWTTKNIGHTAPGNRTINAVAAEGQYSGPMGSSQSYGSFVGLDTTAYLELNLDWDWTSAPGNAMDGGYVERPDQDYQSFWLNATTEIGLGTPYFNREGTGSITNFTAGASGTMTDFSPNRQVPSPVIFGTLPSSTTVGWQTLAFSPNQASTMDTTSGSTHPGVAVSNLNAGDIEDNAKNPPYQITGTNTLPDHLLLDLFWMPVAEPYPISEQFSTAGKINLNYTMMPFPYIERKTGMDAVLKSVWIYALPNTGLIPQDYKSWDFMSNYGGNGRSSNSGNLITRYPINVDETLKAFDYKFVNGDIFRSASQICDMFLFPNDRATPRDPLATWSANPPPNPITQWWAANGMMTSDNGREAPYNAIYSRVTTQSNTYMVHWRVQALHKLTINGSTANIWVEGTDRVVSELRGSTLIERYLDPNVGATAANAIPDYANPSICSWNTSGGSGWTSGGSTTVYPITYYYKWRIDNETYFQPQP